MRRLCYAMVLASAVWGPHAVRAQQVFTQDDLAQAGITRPGDLFELAEGWAAASTDGYAWDAAALGMAPEQEPAWLLFVDAVPLDLRALGRANLNLLPLPVSEICRVELYAHPVQIGSVIAPAGAVNVQTCPAPPGVTLRGALDAGNETGDPGPYQYLEDEDRNVDRTGPAAHAAIVVGRAGWHMRATGQIDEHHATGPLIRPRVRTLYRGEKDARIHHRAAGFRAGSQGRWGSTHAWVATSRLEDLRFFPRLGLEVPANHNLVLGHWSGVSAASGLDVRLSAQHTRLATRANPRDVVVDWDQFALRGQIQRHMGRQITLGLRSAFLRTWGLGMDRHQLLLSSTAFVNTGTEPAPGIRLETNLQLSLDGCRLGWQAFGRLYHERLRLALTVHMRRQIPAAVQGYTYWSSLGYRPSGLPQDEAPRLPRSTSTQFAGVAWHAGDAVRLTLTGGVRRLHRQTLIRYMTRYDSLTTGLDVSAAPAAATGTVAWVDGQLRVRVGARHYASVFGRYAYPVAPMHLFRAAWHTRSLVQAALHFAPNERFTVHGRIRYRGPVLWPDYAGAASMAPDRYASAFPGAVLVSATVQKRFWHERLRLSASLRNLLNRPYRTHPGGAESRLSFHVRMQYRFGVFGTGR